MVQRSVLATGLLLLWAASAYATTYLINPEGTGDFATIQEAIDATEDGDVVELAEGTYAGVGNRDIDFYGKAITVRSQSGVPQLCRIDCGGSPSEPHRGFKFWHEEGMASVLEGITIANGFAWKGGGMVCYAFSTPTVIGCVVLNCGAELEGGGVYCYQSSPTFNNCTFISNYAPAGGSVHADQAFPALGNCIISFGTNGEAVGCESGSAPVLTCCDIYGNALGDWVGCIASQLGTNGNISDDPLFCDPEGEIYTLHADSPCAAESNPGCGLIGACPVGCGTSDVKELDPGPRKALLLLPGGANPSRAPWCLTYVIPARAAPCGVQLSVHDTRGRLVRVLVNAPQPAGSYSVSWDGLDSAGQPVAGGVYFCRLAGGGASATQRLVLVR
ncbi:MAG: hypothetical protein KAY24_03320 [Candidatus Eisenbacteria sp.]|nr:hypothetical protein [Candidatus Eisenbacteria bacterium]